jgi:putative glutamine amidotransferase
MARPVVGIIGNSFLINEQFAVHGGGDMDSCAISNVAQCVPLVVPADPRFVSVDDLLETCDGFLLTGARANIHPEEYGEAETEAHGAFNRARDAITLPLVRACVERGQPFLGVCRGFQEVNVAMGGSLHPEIRELDGRDNHRMPPDGTMEEKFELRHPVTVGCDGPFRSVFGAQKVMTNSLHGQGIKEAGERVVIDGHAHDGTPEAIYIDGAAGFSLAVQWHPEWNAGGDPVSRPLYEAFGAAVHSWAKQRRMPLSRSA